MKQLSLVIFMVALAGSGHAESVAELHENELRAIDANNDGFLSKDEFDAFSDYAFQTMDEDRNGTLGQAEAKPFMDIKLFRNADRNGDNVISRPEFDTQMGEDFLSADQDRNGQLD